MHGLVLVRNHSVFLDLRFGTASQKTSGRHTLLVISRKDLSHIYIHLNGSVFGIFIDSFLFWRFDLFGKAPYKKLFVCMYVCKELNHAVTGGLKNSGRNVKKGQDHRIYLFHLSKSVPPPTGHLLSYSPQLFSDPVVYEAARLPLQCSWSLAIGLASLQVSFEKLKSNLNQTWFIDIIWEPSYVQAVKGQRSSEINL